MATSVLRRHFLGDRRGSVGIASAAFIGLLLGFAALSIETSRVYVAKIQVQRTADMANLAAANTQTPIVGSALSDTARATAENVAEINGFGGGIIEIGSEVDQATGGRSIYTRVGTDVSLAMGRLLTDDSELTVGGESWASINNRGPCIGSLIGTVRIASGSNVTGPDCSVQSANYIDLCNSTMAVSSVSVQATSATQKSYLCANSTVTPAASGFAYGKASVDPFATDPRIAAIKTRLAAGWPLGNQPPAALLVPTKLSSNGAAVTYNGKTAQDGIIITQRNQGALSVINSVLTLNAGGADSGCLNPMSFASLSFQGTSRLVFHSGCYQFQSDLVAVNGANVRMDVAPGASVTFVMRGRIVNGTGTMVIGDATYSIARDTLNTAGGNLTLGNGRKVFGADIKTGQGTVTIGDGPHYVLNGGRILGANGGRINVGDGLLVMWGGTILNPPDGGPITFGSGPFYSYWGAVNAQAPITFGNGDFHVLGAGVTVSHNGYLTFGVGNVRLYGGLLWSGGQGFEIGKGGSATDGASTLMVSGNSIVSTSGAFIATGATIATDTGYVDIRPGGKVLITAPTAELPAFGYKNVALVVFGGGALDLRQMTAPKLFPDTLSGLIYAPKSTATIQDSLAVEIPTGGCLQLFAGNVVLNSSPTLPFKPCAATGAGSNDGKVAIVR